MYIRDAQGRLRWVPSQGLVPQWDQPQIIVRHAVRQHIQEEWRRFHAPPADDQISYQGSMASHYQGSQYSRYPPVLPRVQYQSPIPRVVPSRSFHSGRGNALVMTTSRMPPFPGPPTDSHGMHWKRSQMKHRSTRVKSALNIKLPSHCTEKVGSVEYPAQDTEIGRSMGVFQCNGVRGPGKKFSFSSNCGKNLGTKEESSFDESLTEKSSENSKKSMFQERGKDNPKDRATKRPEKLYSQTNESTNRDNESKKNHEELQHLVNDVHSSCSKTNKPGSLSRSIESNYEESQESDFSLQEQAALAQSIREFCLRETQGLDADHSPSCEQPHNFALSASGQDPVPKIIQEKSLSSTSEPDDDQYPSFDEPEPDETKDARIADVTLDCFASMSIDDELEPDKLQLLVVQDLTPGLTKTFSLNESSSSGGENKARLANDKSADAGKVTDHLTGTHDHSLDVHRGAEKVTVKRIEVPISGRDSWVIEEVASC